MREPEPSSGYERLDGQIDWYDSKSISAQRWYKWTKMAEVVLASLVPIFAFLAPWVTALSGAGVLILELVS